MRIGLDVRYLSHGLVGGINIYVKNLVPNLLKAGSEHNFYLYADTKRELEIANIPDHAQVRLLPYHNPLSTAYYDLFMRKRMAEDQLDVVHFPASYGFGPASCPTVITLHDEINIMPLPRIIRTHRKHPKTIANMTYLHLLTSQAVRRANKVIAISEFSKKRILQYSKMADSKIVVIPHACPSDIHRVEDSDTLAEVRQRLDIKRPFILAEAFKNPGVIVRAWRLLSKSLQNDTEIIFFSRSPDVLPVVHEAIESGFARLIVRPARSDLRALFSMAQVFVFPSWFEGFGIPLVEAMTCGAPIIASNTTAIPEVVGDAALLIDVEDHDTLALYLDTLLTQESQREQLREKGYHRVQRFAWPQIIDKLMNTYQQAQSS